jgi:hypothetical protein
LSEAEVGRLHDARVVAGPKPEIASVQSLLPSAFATSFLLTREMP